MGRTTDQRNPDAPPSPEVLRAEADGVKIGRVDYGHSLREDGTVGTTTQLAVALLVAASASAPAGGSSIYPDCFDALVSARIVKQTPTVVPDTGKDTIVMEWPWIVELDVRRVVEGAARTGLLKVLTMQHTYYKTPAGGTEWWLRRNELRGFNAFHLEANSHLPPRERRRPDPALHPSS